MFKTINIHNKYSTRPSLPIFLNKFNTIVTLVLVEEDALYVQVRYMLPLVNAKTRRAPSPCATLENIHLFLGEVLRYQLFLGALSSGLFSLSHFLSP